MAEPVSLDLLQSMVQRVLDGQNLHREDIRNIRRRLSRIEHQLASIESAAGPAAVSRTDRRGLPSENIRDF